MSRSIARNARWGAVAYAAALALGCAEDAPKKAEPEPGEQFPGGETTNTLLLGVMSIVVGVPAGMVVGIIRLYAPWPIRLLMIGYIDVMRAMPVLVMLILIYYALPFLGIRLSSWSSAVLP